jgi:hypothetical protein
VAGTNRVSTADGGRAEQWRGMHVDEGKMGETSICSTLREDKVVTMWGGGHRRRTVTVASSHTVSRARTGDRRKPFKRPLPLTSGPQLVSDFSRFSIFQTLKSKSLTFPMSKINQILHRDSWKHKEQLSFQHNFKFPHDFKL